MRPRPACRQCDGQLTFTCGCSRAANDPQQSPAMVALTGAAQAALVSLGDGTVKDTNTNLIWLQDWTVNG